MLLRIFDYIIVYFTLNNLFGSLKIQSIILLKNKIQINYNNNHRFCPLSLNMQDNNNQNNQASKRLLSVLKSKKNAKKMSTIKDTTETSNKFVTLEPSLKVSKKSSINDLVNKIKDVDTQLVNKVVSPTIYDSTLNDDLDNVEIPIPVIKKELGQTSYVTEHEFNSLDISMKTKKALSDQMGYKYMTVVQHESLPEILKGHDVLVKARTGTGKTLGFLIPAIEILIKERSRVELANRALSREVGKKSGNLPTAKILILSPTRELAQQIVQEATVLCTYHTMGCILLVGGTNIASDVKALSRTNPGSNDIIVATPGRMLAHLKETPGFDQQIKGVKVFIMDEADRLLDMGFSNDINQITNYLNRRDSKTFGPRQTLLFSATVAPEIRKIANSTLLPGYKIIDTVGDEVEQTHSHVPQIVMSVPLNQQLPAIIQLLEQHIAKNPNGYKVMMFFATARQTAYYASVLNNIGMPCVEMHSRKAQGYRTRVAEEFRSGTNMIMASSDVSARGMDYPDVTFVLQVGATDKDQYIHRLGRTARAGKSGAGLLLLAPFEYNYMVKKELVELPLQVTLQNDILPNKLSPLAEKGVATVRDLAAPSEFGEDKEQDGANMAWGAWLGFYNGWCKKLSISKEQLVLQSMEYAQSLGLDEIPALPKKTIGKMGMQGVPGLRIDHSFQARSGRNNNNNNNNNNKSQPKESSNPNNNKDRNPSSTSSSTGPAKAYVPRTSSSANKNNNPRASSPNNNGNNSGNKYRPKSSNK